MLYDGAAERIEAVSKSSGPRDSIAARAYRGTSSVMAVAIMISGMLVDVVGFVVVGERGQGGGGKSERGSRNTKRKWRASACI